MDETLQFKMIIIGVSILSIIFFYFFLIVYKFSYYYFKFPHHHVLLNSRTDRNMTARKEIFIFYSLFFMGIIFYVLFFINKK